LEELGGALEETPFVRALRSSDCEGLVMLIDGQGTPFTRIWCVLEVTIRAQSGNKKKMDVACYNDPGEIVTGSRSNVDGMPAVLLDLGNGEHDCKGFFKDDAAVAGVNVHVEAAQASHSPDKDAILQYIKDEFGGCGAVNHIVQMIFGGKVIRGAALDNDIAKLQKFIDMDCGKCQAHQPQDCNNFD